MTVFAYDYPILGVFWSMVWLFLWIAWIFLLFRVIADIFRSHDMSGWGKALWAIFVVVVPFLGVFIYLIARGQGMAERDVAQARSSEAAFQSYVRETAGSDGGTASELSKLADLRAQGVLTDAEFEAQKAKLLS
jgi:Short C-terminal domain/Phospholipase_D-nuclease N-terminal